MSWRKIFIYLFFLVIISALYSYQQVKTRKTQQIKEQEKQICPFKKVEEIKSYTLKTEYGLFQLERKGKKWWLTSPVSDWANFVTSSQLLETIVNSKVERKITPLPKDISPYGLDRPRIEVNLTSDKKTWGLKLGGDTPDGRRVYAITTDKKAIYLFPNSLFWSLNKRLGELRDKHIIEFDPVKVTRLSFQGKEIHLTLEKHKNQWYIKQPFKAKADNDEVENLLYRLQAEQIKAFIKKGVSPQLKIELWEDIDKPPYWLKLTLEKEELIGQSNYHPSWFTLRKDLWKDIIKKPEILKDRHFVKFNKEKVDKVEIIYGKKQLLAQKNKAKWEIKPKNLAKAYEIDFFLEDLLNLKYLPEKITPSALASWQARVKLWNKKAQLVLDMKCYKHKDQSWVKYKDRFYRVNNNFWGNFPQNMK